MKRSILTVLAVVLFSIVTMAQPPQHKRGGERQKGGIEKFEKMIQELELTEEQQGQVKEIHFKSKKSAKNFRNELGEKEARLRTLTTADAPNDKAIKSLAQEIGDLKGDLFVMKVMSRQEIRTLLTEEQKLKFDMQDRRGMRKGRNQ